MPKLLTVIVLLMTAGFAVLALTIYSELNRDNSYQVVEPNNAANPVEAIQSHNVREQHDLSKEKQAELSATTGVKKVVNKPFFKQSKLRLVSDESEVSRNENIQLAQKTTLSDKVQINDEHEKRLIEAGQNPDQLIKKRTKQQRDF